MPSAVLWLVASYFIGAIPTSYLLSRFFAGIDLRQQGSGNLGATNLYRVLGWKYAIPAALVDIAKGFVPVVVFAPRESASRSSRSPVASRRSSGMCSLSSFDSREGKVWQRRAGVMLGLTPLALARRAAVWARWCRITGYVSLASISAAAVLPVAVYLLEDGDARIALDRRRDCSGSDRAASAEHRAPPQGNREPVRSPSGEHAELMTAIAVLGAGSWGTTLANLLALKGESVRLWAYEQEVVETINRQHENTMFLPGVSAVAAAARLR